MPPEGHDVIPSVPHPFGASGHRQAGSASRGRAPARRPGALVIAETPAAARDGAERVRVDWEPLPSVSVTAEAATAGAPRGWEEATSNVCVDSHAGDAVTADAAFARAAHVVRLETWVQRVTGVPMEPRAAVAVYDEASGRHTLYAGPGGSVRIKSDLAAPLRVPERAVRVG